MDWIDSFNGDFSNENREDYTGLIFLRSHYPYQDHYGWCIEDLCFRKKSDLESFLLAFSLRYRGRKTLGTFSDYGIEDGFHLFQAEHPYLIVHIHAISHPLKWPMITGEVEIDRMELFSPNRDILQLALKGVRICCRWEDEINVAGFP